MKNFYNILANQLVAGVTSTFVWFALTYWSYLETQSVIVTSVISGVFLLCTAFSGFWFGSIVDHNKKKNVLILSSTLTLAFFLLGFFLYSTSPADTFASVDNPKLWILILFLMLGVIAGNFRNITMPIIVTIMVPEGERDKANGLLGTIMGISFSITSIASGLALGFSNMYWVLLSATVLTFLCLVHAIFSQIPEKDIVHTEDKPKKLDIKGTIAAIKGIPGLFALIFFTTFNNFLGGVFMSLMDPYGLTLVSVQTWGLLWGVLSIGFIGGGMYIAKYGLGKTPLKNLFKINILLWTICIFMGIQPWIVLLAICMFGWIFFVPFVEATEHTIIQKVVPLERQGRVFGFAQSVEQMASPITAFLIGPIAQLIFIPFMTTGRGVQLIGNWFGVGPGRGIALVFMVAGVIGLITTLIAMRSKSYKILDDNYQKPSEQPAMPN